MPWQTEELLGVGSNAILHRGAGGGSLEVGVETLTVRCRRMRAWRRQRKPVVGNGASATKRSRHYAANFRFT